ncbi:MAG: hypothetical protein PHE88_04355 [Elusimicrobia bacterium]|nr:hypothetical protein [Elusimicrobiota bacterium]
MENSKKDSGYSVLFVLFLLSGFCGLLYQIVWLRLAFAAFGIITPVLSVVLSVFMLGLAVGSWAGGKYIKKLTDKTGKTAIVFYALTELLIGVGGLLVPRIFDLGQKLLLTTGEFNSFRYLVYSAGILGISILPWCILMGATVPFAMSFMKEVNSDNKTGFSYLYVANVIGAMCGTIITAIFLIEILGLHNTILVAVCCNFLIAITAFILSLKYPYKKFLEVLEQIVVDKSQDDSNKAGFNFLLLILFTTGFASMGMEVVWTRAFTPVLKTTIYSFASILTVYLFATWQGSLLYRKHVDKQHIIDVSDIMVMLVCFSFLPILASDLRLWQILRADAKIAVALISIFPFCATLGYLTPKLVDEFSQGNPKFAGRAYAVNTVGCIVGPLVAGYIFLPFVGVKISLFLFLIPFIIYFVYYLKKIWQNNIFKTVVASIFTVVLIVYSLFFSVNYEDIVLYKPGQIRRDYVATVISLGKGRQKELLVNGIGMTSLTPITKYMAHIPLTIRNRKPESALIICFGMGTTFRSAVSWGIKTTAVELVPSVKDAFGFYFDDAKEVMEKPNATIVIDDGRRFLKRTSEKFDLIAIDPPPPIASSGSSLLYSVEFYRLLKTRLKDDGILAQWFPFGEEMTFKAIAKSISLEFPYVRVFHSIENWGFHFFASMKPFEMPSVNNFIVRIPPLAANDLVEWNPGKKPEQLYRALLQNEVPIGKIVTDDVDYSITDDRPFNEYFLLRRKFNKMTHRHKSVW